MAANNSHHVLHRMVPLICQGLTTFPGDTSTWLEGLRLLANPKLRTAMTMTTSIWLPLLIKGLEVSRPEEVILAALKLLGEVAEILEPMKSCFIKPLRALGRKEVFCEMAELSWACTRMGIVVWSNDRREIGRPNLMSAAGTPLPMAYTPGISLPSPANLRDHPLLSEILDHNLPSKLHTVRQAWSHSLMSLTQENPAVWLHNLFQATLEASAVPEMIITSKLGPLVHTELFQTAFILCYKNLESDLPFKELVDQAIIHILLDPMTSKDVRCVFLDLVAFFDKERYVLDRSICDAAKTCALGKFTGGVNEALPAIALWYVEQQTEEDMTAENIANLVEVNIRIGASGYDSAWSSLLWLRDDYKVETKPIWITQLSHWQTAVAEQDRIDEGGPVRTFTSLNTRMICYHALGQFERGYALAQSLFEGLNDHERRTTAHWATAAAWHMGDYEAMADYLAFHPKGTSKSLYKAIIDVHHGQYTSAFRHISKAQSLSYDELQTQLGAGPQVALKTLAKTEILVELQEVIQYKSQPDLREHILSVWRARFKRSHANANSWLKRLQVWTLACPTTTVELQHCYLECAKLCESSGMHEAAQRIIELVTPTSTPPGCKVEYTRMRFQWKNAFEHQKLDDMSAILNHLHLHVARYLESLGVDRTTLEIEGLGLRPLTSTDEVEKSGRSGLARRFYRLAQWTEIKQGSYWLTDPDSEVYRYYSLAYKLDTLWFDGGYSLAQAAINIFEANAYHRSDMIAVNSYIVPAIRGLFQSVRSRETPEKMIKALLRLVTLWFRYGESPSVLVEVSSQLTATPISSWLMAVPQLIARLGTLHKELQGVLLDLLKDIANHYPHAVIWPLLTASQTKKAQHDEAARVIMDYICSMPDGSRLVGQAELVGRELIRTSISWMEKWRNLIDRCLPRQDLMEIAWQDVPLMWEDDMIRLSTPETPDEELFLQQYGTSLQAVYKTLVKYRSTKQVNLVNTAYTELYRLYGEIDVQLNQWRLPGSKLYLATSAPRLLSLRDCILTVPGQYDPNIALDDQAFIDIFPPTVDILSSKQLPRKLVIRSYTKDYTFLLKGNEDMRGDERIMQLFTLINTLLNHESEAFDRNLHLLPYEVIPLSPSAGLVSWVPNTQQLQAMIQANRDKDRTNRLTNRELASLLGYDPETFDPKSEKTRLDPPVEMDKYDKLPLDLKVERLKGALSHPDQSDLKDVLWRRSPSAEIWLRRRTNFARTVGVGSFVGHIIGLGDRHGSNILVDQLTWGALHIDFGDLFSVAQDRSFLPERVPFRLTRMMTNAFELACSKGHKVPGSRGSFKQASIVTMGVLRDSRSTLLAMLEAFIYDPLLSWTPHDGSDAAPITGADTPHITQQKKTAKTVRNKQYTATHAVPQSIAPVRQGNENCNSDVYNRINNSLIQAYLDSDSYMAKVSGTGMTNAKALHVLGTIEKKLLGYNDGPTALPVKKQVQELIEQATDLKNLSQGYVLGWIPYW